ncbi:MAG: YCF48-related protein [bacterium]
MKKIIVLSLFLYFVSFEILAQWNPQNSGLQTGGLNDLYFINEYLGWVVGEGPDNKAVVLKTINGGLLWSIQQIELAPRLTSVWFIDSLTGWTCGRDGIILKTIDGGYSWIEQNSGTDESIGNIQFLDKNNGWACHMSGILKTIDSGITWTPCPTGVSDRYCYTFYFTDLSTGWLGMGYYGRPSKILYTNDGGTNWTEQSNPLESVVADIFFINNDIGWAIDVVLHIAKTTNGGKDWILQNTTEEYLGPVFFVSPDTGWAVGGSDIFITTDGGDTWIPQNSNTSNSLRRVFFVNSKTGWAIGNDCTILKYDCINPSLAVQNPNGSESYFGGQKENIRWSYANIENIIIEYTINNGIDWNTITESRPAADLYYSWRIPNTPSTECKVRISDVNHLNVSDESDNVFSIKYRNPEIQVQSPNGGEYLTIGKEYDVKWYSLCVDVVDIQYTYDNGDNWISIVESYPADSSTYSWTIPNLVSSYCKIKVINADQPSISDESDNMFSIVDWDNEKIKILCPNGGEYYPARTNQVIFTNKNSSYGYDTYISYNNGLDWNQISLDWWEWIVTDTVSDHCLFKIIHQTDSTDYDICDSVFSIVDGPIPIELNFPLQVGNKWFFSYSHTAPNLTILEVTKDTIWSDGNEYAKIEMYDFSDMKWDTTDFVYLRQENNIVFRKPDLEFFGDTLLNAGWTYKGDFLYYVDIELRYSEIFNTYKPTWYIYEAYPVDYTSFSQDFGFNGLNVITWRDWMNETRILRGCVLNGKNYGYITVLGIDNKKEVIPDKFILNQNYPNPFNSITTITYSISKEAFVKVRIIDLNGRTIENLICGRHNPGNYSIKYIPHQLTTGIYFCCMETGNNIQVKKMIYLK